MREFVLLDSGLLGYACKRPGTPWADRYRNWVDGLLARGVDIVLPEISDYEVRRELLRIQAFASLQRLDELIETGNLLYLPIRTPAWREAAQLWADARNRGRPTA